jgi:hypothetical protein
VKVLSLQSNNLTLSTNVEQLAHLYDLSTNALAEANARLLSVSNIAERSSAPNQPIKSVDGYGAIGISRDAIPLFERMSGKTPFIELLNGFDSNSPIALPINEVGIVGRIENVETDRVGNLVVHINFEADRQKSHGVGTQSFRGWGTNLTFNNMRAVRIDFASPSETPFKIVGGFISVTVDGLFESEFRFLPQTNKTELPWGIVGLRENPWEIPIANKMVK